MVSERAHPLLALVGRPNVGKSTLFNRLLGIRKAVVSSTRGTTRDRLYGRVEWRGVTLTLIDTGGVDLAAADELTSAIQRHVQQALHEADGFIFLGDAQEGIVPADEMILDSLRKIGKPIILAVNKADHQVTVPPDFFSLGLNSILAVSALHGRGIGELLDSAVESFGGRAVLQDREGIRSIPNPTSRQPGVMAVIGRQNVGKSSLFNSILHDERAVVSHVPGTTRDAVEASLIVQGEALTLIDTAGLKPRRRVKHPVEVFSMSRTVEAIRRCDVAFVVLDATQGVTREDRRIVTHVSEHGRGLVILLNKWDLMRGISERSALTGIRHALPAARWAPIIPISARTGLHVERGLATAIQVMRAMRRGLSDAACLILFQRVWNLQGPPRVRGRTIRLERARWIAGRPPQIELITSPIGLLPAPYLNTLQRHVRASPHMAGVPIRLTVRPDRTSRWSR